jgi:hypothetical protein
MPSGRGAQSRVVGCRITGFRSRAREWYVMRTTMGDGLTRTANPSRLEYTCVSVGYGRSAWVGYGGSTAVQRMTATGAGCSVGCAQILPEMVEKPTYR